MKWRSQLAERAFAYLRPYLWPYFTLALVCMVLFSATSGAIPYLVRTLVDEVLTKADAEQLAIMPVVVVVVFLFRALVSFGHGFLGEYVGQHIVFDVRGELNEKIQTLPVAFFDRHASGNVMSRMTTDVLLFRQAVTDGVTVLIRDLTSVTFLLAVTFYMDFALAVITFIVFPAVVLPLQALSKRMRALSHKGLDSLGDLSALLQETLIGNRVVKAFGMQDYEKQRFDTENRHLLRINMRAARIRAATSPMTEMFSAFGIAAVVAYGGQSVIGGDRTIGNFMGFVTALALLYEPFKKVVRTNNIIQQGLGAAERIFEVLDLPGEAADATAGRTISGLRDAIRFEEVGFAYGEENVLHDASLEIPAGNVVALVGPSGGGKSTLADLIPRFYDVSSGRVTLDGIDIRELALESLRKQISVVTQFTFLFNDTVRNNIAYGNPDTSEEEIVSAAKAANAHEFIGGLPNGYQTVVGELGVQLSGGQRQRIAIARALLKNAPILILDEATSALDTESERQVQGAIEHLMAGRTTLVIAHRLSTVQSADIIVVIDGGRIVETGTHEELVAGSSLYKRLHDMQLQTTTETTGESGSVN